MNNFKILQEKQYGWKAENERNWSCVMSQEGAQIGQLRIFFIVRTPGSP